MIIELYSAHGPDPRLHSDSNHMIKVGDGTMEAMRVVSAVCALYITFREWAQVGLQRGNVVFVSPAGVVRAPA